MRKLTNLVLDTSAFIQGYTASDTETRLYTTPLVLDEIRDDMARIRAENWRHTGKLIVQVPDEASIKHIVSQAKRMGEAQSLSETDISVLALTHQIGDATLVSDDYSVQNLADELELSYRGMNTRGIKRRFQWIHYCPGCRKQYTTPQEDNRCPICGTELKRKPGKKSRSRGGE